jgi:hypothetical protein
MPDEQVLLERFFPDYAMSEDDVVLIALAHVRQYDLEYDGVDDDTLFKGLGITDSKKRKMLERRVAYYDDPADEVTSHYRFLTTMMLQRWRRGLVRVMMVQITDALCCSRQSLFLYSLCCFWVIGSGIASYSLISILTSL